jgi:hypothetical protein
MLTAKLVTTNKEIDQITALSQANLVSNLSAETKQKEGFVTWVYTPEILQAIHAIVASVIVMDGDTLAGYAITLTPDCADIYPPLKSTIAHVSTLSYKGRPLSQQRIYFMGQICVAEPYRGQGVVSMLYEFHRRQFSPQFDLFITEISPANPRSMKAHQKIGFQTIDIHQENGSDWAVVLWDFT